MAGAKGKSGGSRQGSGRKPKSSPEMPENRHKTGFRGPSPDVGKATQFRPGQSPNPGGRPKRKPMTDAYSARLDQKVSEYFGPDELARIPKKLRETTVADFIAYSVIGEVVAGRNKVHAAREITDRVEGKVPLAVMGVSDTPLELTIISKMSRPKRQPPAAVKTSASEDTKKGDPQAQ